MIRPPIQKSPGIIVDDVLRIFRGAKVIIKPGEPCRVCGLPIPLVQDQKDGCWYQNLWIHKCGSGVVVAELDALLNEEIDEILADLPTEKRPLKKRKSSLRREAPAELSEEELPFEKEA